MRLQLTHNSARPRWWRVCGERGKAMRSVYVSLITGTVLLGLCYSAAAQTATGILEGRVTDASGSAVPDANVTIENQLTGVHQSPVTNAEGIFVQPFLLPGEYRVTVEKPGFQKFVST